MNIIIASKNMNTSDRLKETIEEKISKLDKYFSSEVVVHITLSTEKGRDTIEATINARGTIFRAEETSSDIYTGLDRVVEKLSSQMSRFKTKLQRKHKDNKELQLSDLPVLGNEEVEEMSVARTKNFDLMPMTVDEAIMQMELLEHSFFIFLNMDSDSVNVVYKRKDNSYGLLEPRY